MIILSKTAPNGAQTEYHRLIRAEMVSEGLVVYVNSYVAEDSELVSWQDSYALTPTAGVLTFEDLENQLTQTGAPFAGGSVISAADSDFSKTLTVVKAKLKARRDTAEWAGVQTGQGEVDSDPDSQRKISGAVTMAMLGGESFSMQWRMKDNSVVTLNAAQTIAMGVAVGQHVAACQVNKNTIDSLIEACTTVEELLAVDIEEGWP